MLSFSWAEKLSTAFHTRQPGPGAGMLVWPWDEIGMDGPKDRPCGEGGIRTHGGPKDHNGFRDRPVQPLRHLSPGAIIAQLPACDEIAPGGWWGELGPWRSVAGLELYALIHEGVGDVFEACLGQFLGQFFGGLFFTVNEKQALEGVFGCQGIFQQ